MSLSVRAKATGFAALAVIALGMPFLFGSTPEAQANSPADFNFGDPSQRLPNVVSGEAQDSTFRGRPTVMAEPLAPPELPPIGGGGGGPAAAVIAARTTPNMMFDFGGDGIITPSLRVCALNASNVLMCGTMNVSGVSATQASWMEPELLQGFPLTEVDPRKPSRRSNAALVVSSPDWLYNGCAAYGTTQYGQRTFEPSYELLCRNHGFATVVSSRANNARYEWRPFWSDAALPEGKVEIPYEYDQFHTRGAITSMGGRLWLPRAGWVAPTQTRQVWTQLGEGVQSPVPGSADLSDLSVIEPVTGVAPEANVCGCIKDASGELWCADIQPGRTLCGGDTGRRLSISSTENGQAITVTKVLGSFETTAITANVPFNGSGQNSVFCFDGVNRSTGEVLRAQCARITVTDQGLPQQINADPLFRTASLQNGERWVRVAGHATVNSNSSGVGSSRAGGGYFCGLSESGSVSCEASNVTQPAINIFGNSFRAKDIIATGPLNNSSIVCALSVDGNEVRCRNHRGTARRHFALDTDTLFTWRHGAKQAVIGKAGTCYIHRGEISGIRNGVVCSNGGFPRIDNNDADIPRLFGADASNARKILNLDAVQIVAGSNMMPTRSVASTENPQHSVGAVSVLSANGRVTTWTGDNKEYGPANHLLKPLQGDVQAAPNIIELLEVGSSSGVICGVYVDEALTRARGESVRSVACWAQETVSSLFIYMVQVEVEYSSNSKGVVSHVAATPRAIRQSGSRPDIQVPNWICSTTHSGLNSVVSCGTITSAGYTVETAAVVPGNAHGMVSLFQVNGSRTDATATCLTFADRDMVCRDGVNLNSDANNNFYPSVVAIKKLVTQFRARGYNHVFTGSQTPAQSRTYASFGGGRTDQDVCLVGHRGQIGGRVIFGCERIGGNRLRLSEYSTGGMSKLIGPNEVRNTEREAPWFKIPFVN